MGPLEHSSTVAASQSSLLQRRKISMSRWYGDIILRWGLIISFALLNKVGDGALFLYQNHDTTTDSQQQFWKCSSRRCSVLFLSASFCLLSYIIALRADSSLICRSCTANSVACTSLFALSSFAAAISLSDLASLRRFFVILIAWDRLHWHCSLCF